MSNFRIFVQESQCIWAYFTAYLRYQYVFYHFLPALILGQEYLQLLSALLRYPGLIRMVIMMGQLPGFLRVIKVRSQIGPLLPGQGKLPLVSGQHPPCQGSVPVVFLHDFPQEQAEVIYLHIDFKMAEVHQGRLLPVKHDIMMDILAVAEVFALHSLPVERLTPGSLQKIQGLQKKKKMYEEVLKRQLDALNSDYAMLQMQSEELRVRNLKGQTKLCA